MNDAITIFDHVDGSRSELHYDDDASYANPREDDGNVATLIQTDRSYVDIDTDDAGIGEARERFDGYRGRWQSWMSYRTTPNAAVVAAHGRYDRDDMVRRYLSIFRPDILHYDGNVSLSNARSGGSGWGYVTREAYERAMLTDAERAAGMTAETVVGSRPGAAETMAWTTPAVCFEQERDVYAQWAAGEVYGVVTFDPTDCRVCGRKVRPAYDGRGEPAWTAGELVDGVWADDDGTDGDPTLCDDSGEHVVMCDGRGEACWGFLGYDNERDIVAQVNDADIVSEH